MRLERIAARLGLVVLVVLTGFVLLALVRWADAAYAKQRQAADAAPAPSAAAWTQVFHFEHATAPRELLVAGWSTPDPGAGVWSSAPRAVLRLPPAPFAGPAEVALTVEAFIVPAQPFQRVVARAGDRVLGEWRLTKAETATLRFTVPPELRGDRLDLQLDLPDAGSPTKLVEGAMDARLLAIKLRQITVTG